jgi:O-antigen ligase
VNHSPSDTVTLERPPAERRQDATDRRVVADAWIWSGLVLSGIVAVLVGVAVGRFAIDRSVVVVVLGMLMGGALALLAVTRFAAFLVVLIAIRATLDGLKLSGVGSSALGEPGVLVGGVLLLASVLWLIAQGSAGTLVPPSRTARWLLVVGAVSIFGAFGSPEPVQSLQSGARVLAGALTFVVLEQLLARRPQLLRGLLVAVTVSLVIPVVTAVTQLIRPSELYAFATVSRINGTFVHPNALAAYLVIVALVALGVAFATDRWVRTVAMVVVVVCSTLLVFTYARAAWAAMLIGALYLLAQRRRRLVWVLIAVCVAVALLVPSIGSRLGDLSSSAPTPGDGDANSLSWRVEYWQEILPLWAENPVSGIGLDQVSTRTPSGNEPHSGFVQALVETGIVGFVALVALVVALSRDLAAARRRATDELDRWMALAATAVAVGFLLQLFTENLLTQVAIHVYFWIPIAYATSILVRPQSTDPERGRVEPPGPELTPASADD